MVGVMLDKGRYVLLKGEVLSVLCYTHNFA